MQKAMRERYDFSDPSKMKWDIKRVNDMHFEYHRLSLMYKLEAAKEKERNATDDQQVELSRLKLEQEILEKDALWQRVEEDLQIPQPSPFIVR